MQSPSGKAGDWRVVSIDASNDEGLQLSRKGFNDYKFLIYQKTLVMSFIPSDIIPLRALWENACGSVLLTGLGLGCAITVIIDKPEVKDVTVLEK